MGRRYRFFHAGFGGFGGGGFIQNMANMGLGMPGGFMNRWLTPGFNYQGMNGFNYVDYGGGWNPNIHDQMLVAKINIVFQRYDMNMSGQLEGN